MARLYLGAGFGPQNWLRIIVMLLLAVVALVPASLRAQVATTYSNTTTGTINNTTPCGTPLVRNFTVGTSYTISDVDIGILATHTWRGDMRITLQSPTGTRVQLVNGDTNNISGNNFNVLLDDSAAQLVNTDSATGNHSTSAPPYQNNFRPNNPLSAFAGENALGTWRLEICDLFPSSDNGTFQRADLTITSTPANYADLSLTKTMIGAAPVNGGAVTWRLSVTNSASSPNTATGVSVKDYLPVAFTFISASGTGSFNSGTGVWSVGSIAPGQTVTMDITGSISATAGVTITNNAEITASSITDLDSTVNNGITTEDDYATHSFVVAGTRGAGTPPTLSCPVGSTLFDWNTIAWTAGTTNNTYALGGYGNINFNLVNPGTWLNNAGLGGQSPNVTNAVNGGFTGQSGLIELVDLPDQVARVTSTITLPMAMQGAQFRIYDVDYAAGQFADFVRVEGRYQSGTVIPVLTNGVSNYNIGNEAYGDAASANTSADGNLVVTFNSPIDQIIIYYGDHAMAPANPGQQAISIGNMTFCNPTTTLAVTKDSTLISDPYNGTTNPKSIPGAIMQYCIAISNTGPVAASNVIATDTLPANVTYIAGSMRSGSTCAGASTVEDDNAAGADESDPFGASISGANLTAVATTLNAAQVYALRFQATVN